MKKLNVFATEDELQEILKLHKKATSTPVITLGSGIPDFASMAWQELHEKIDNIAISKGLP